MEAPPPLSTTTPKAPATDSVDSSPRSYEPDPPPPPPPSKLRLMCSYGGHIVPRPHDKSLCYIGGDTRIIAIDRNNSSLADLHNRLSKTLLHNQPFVLKYQLPNEDLDSLISVATDEDLENMVDEYDRLSGGSSRGGGAGGRLRLFLFPKSAASCTSVEQILVGNASTKSEDWFLDALNGKSTTNLTNSERGFSESSSVNCLLGLDDDFGGGAKAKEAEFAKNNGGGGGIGVVGNNSNSNNNNNNQDVHSVPDSPMLDTTSSFGSTSSSPSIMVNLPPIRVHVEENPKVGIEEQFQQMSVVNSAVVQKQEEVVATTTTAVSGIPVVVGGEYGKRVFSDDERSLSSDHGGYRLVQQFQPQVQLQQQHQQIPQVQQRQPSAFDLASPDSASSEGSVTNPLSRQRQAIYQEPIMQMQSRVMPNQVDQKTAADQQNNNNKVHMQPQVQESGYVLSGQYEQNHPQMHQSQQFVHAGGQYIPAGAMQMPAYYHVYPSQQQHYTHQPVLDQQYPVYYMPARQNQAYNMPVQQQQQQQQQQPSHSEMAPPAPSSTPPPAAMNPHATYNQGRNAPSNKPEMAAGVYRTNAPQLVQVPSGQHQGQYVGVPQMHYPSQSMAPTSAANSTYAYEYADPGHSQVYYTQALPPQMAAQYQTMTSAPTMVLSDGSSQLASENAKQQARTTQP